MKYTIQINQYIFKDRHDVLKENKIDYNDLAIVSLFLNRVESGDLNSFSKHGKAYYKLNWTYVLHNLPFLKMSGFHAYNYRLKKLEAAGLIERCTKNNDRKNTWLRPGKKAKLSDWFNDKFAKKPAAKKAKKGTEKEALNSWYLQLKNGQKT